MHLNEILKLINTVGTSGAIEKIFAMLEEIRQDVEVLKQPPPSASTSKKEK